MERLTRWMLRHPRKIVVAFCLLTLFFGLEIRNLRIDPSMEIFIPEGHPEVVFFREMREVFGLFNFVMVGIVDEREAGIFQTEPLQLVMDLSQAFATIPEIYFGLFIALTMFTASVATLTLLPCLIYSFRPRFLQKETRGRNSST